MLKLWPMGPSDAGAVADGVPQMTVPWLMMFNT